MGDGSPPACPGAEPRWGSGGEARRSYRYNVIYCAYKTGLFASFVCISLLKHALKLKRPIIIAQCTYFRLL